MSRTEVVACAHAPTRSFTFGRGLGVPGDRKAFIHVSDIEGHHGAGMWLSVESVRQVRDAMTAWLEDRT